MSPQHQHYESNRQLNITVKVINDSCDESKCVSKGMSHLHNNSFTCYGDDGIFYPMMCADGFLPQVVASNDDSPYDATDVDRSGDASLRYFTCCPPQHSSFEVTTDVSRHCSDPITIPIDFEADNDAICNDQDTRDHPRRMKQALEESQDQSEKESFLCCDSIPSTERYDYDDDYENNTTKKSPNFLEYLECVPYRDEFYDASMVHNQFGRISVISCDFREGGFPFPRPVGEGAMNDATPKGLYQCCRNGPSLPPYVQDNAFKMTIYPSLVLSFLAAFTSAIVVISILIPLLIQLKNGSYQRAQKRGLRRRPRVSVFSRASGILSSSWEFLRRQSMGSTPTSDSIPLGGSALASGYSNIPEQRSRHERLKSQVSTISNPPRSSNIEAQVQCFSTYNLYLVYLAFIDFAYNLFIFCLYARIVHQKFNLNFYSIVVSPSNGSTLLYSLEITVAVAFTNANLWINAIMAHQVLVLLKKSKRARKINHPSLTRVNFQGGAVYVSSIILGVIDYSVRNAVWKAKTYGNSEKSETILCLGILQLWNTLMLLLPIGYVIYISILVWWKGFLPSLNRINAKGEAMRELALYYFRIIAVFLFFWIPCIFVANYSLVVGSAWGFSVATLGGVTQAIVSTCMMLTKSDVRKYVLDLINISCIFSNCSIREKRHSKLRRSEQLDESPFPETGSEKMEDRSKTCRTGTSGNIEESKLYDLLSIELESDSCREQGSSGTKPRRSVVRFDDFIIKDISNTAISNDDSNGNASTDDNIDADGDGQANTDANANAKSDGDDSDHADAGV